MDARSNQPRTHPSQLPLFQQQQQAQEELRDLPFISRNSCFPQLRGVTQPAPFAVFNEAHVVKNPSQAELSCLAISRGTGRDGNN